MLATTFAVYIAQQGIKINKPVTKRKIQLILYICQLRAIQLGFSIIDNSKFVIKDLFPFCESVFSIFDGDEDELITKTIGEIVNSDKIPEGINNTLKYCLELSLDEIKIKISFF